MRCFTRLIALLCVSWAGLVAVDFHSGDKVRLVATHQDGVPVRDQPGATKYERWPDAIEALVVVDTGNWVQIEVGGKKVWVVEPYLKAVDGTSTSQPTSTFNREYLYADAPTRTTYPNQWVVLTNVGYQSAYDESFKNPAWVAYHLSGVSQFLVNPRPPGYPTDDRTTSKVDEADYPSGYDHGHLAPNNAIGLFFGDQGQDETFFMSNMLPQKHGLNAGPWKTVETAEYTRWTGSGKQIWIIAGPVYTDTDNQPVNPTNRAPPKQVCIPVACFKIVMAEDLTGKLQTMAFIMPQENAAGHKPAEFLFSIRTIEKRTGLNFFSSWPQALQDEIELKVADKLW